MIDRGIARDGYKVLDDTGAEIGYVDQRIAGAIFEKKYCDGVCTATARRDRQRHCKWKSGDKASKHK